MKIPSKKGVFSKAARNKLPHDFPTSASVPSSDVVENRARVSHDVYIVPLFRSRRAGTAHTPNPVFLILFIGLTEKT